MKPILKTARDKIKKPILISSKVTQLESWFNRKYGWLLTNGNRLK